MDHSTVNERAAGARRPAHAGARREHWRRTRRLTGVLLLLWFGASFGTMFFARQLAGFALFGWPLPFYLAAQGAPLIFLAILGGYALAMRRIDARLRARERQAP